MFSLFVSKVRRQTSQPASAFQSGGADLQVAGGGTLTASYIIVLNVPDTAVDSI
jgi:hypothetical protein